MPGQLAGNGAFSRSRRSVDGDNNSRPWIGGQVAVFFRAHPRFRLSTLLRPLPGGSGESVARSVTRFCGCGQWLACGASARPCAHLFWSLLAWQPRCAVKPAAPRTLPPACRWLRARCSGSVPRPAWTCASRWRRLHGSHSACYGRCHCPFFAVPCAQRTGAAWRELPLERAPLLRDAPRATRPFEEVDAGLRFRV